MLSAAALRKQIETALADRIPSALTPLQRQQVRVADTGIPGVDELLQGGLPLGGITEMIGPECSGRTSLAVSFIARRTQSSKFCAWIDISDTFDPESAAANQVDLSRLLWVRCSAHPPVQPSSFSGKLFTVPELSLTAPKPLKGLHGGGFGPHPRTEVKGLSQALDSFLQPQQPATPLTSDTSVDGALNPPIAASNTPQPVPSPKDASKRFSPSLRSPKPQKPWETLNRALLVTDILLQAGGFDSIVLDMGSIAPEHVSRIPLATWFRYRAAADKSQSCILLLAQHASTQSSADLVVTMAPSEATSTYPTILEAFQFRLDVTRTRHSTSSPNVIPLKKPPRSVHTATWQSHSTSWSAR